MMQADLDLVRRIAAAKGTISQGPLGWQIDGTREIVDDDDVTVLRHAGHLSGKRKRGHLRLAASSMKMTGGKPPAIGIEVSYRINGAPARGRIVRADAAGLSALVVPNVEHQTDGRHRVLHTLSRPHRGAPWKGTAMTLGWYRADPLWPTLEAWPGLLPAIWSAPLTSVPRTLARLREVRKKLVVIDARNGLSTEEEAAKAICYDWHENWLYYFRGTAARERHLGHVAVADYLDAVLVHDAVEIERSELEHMRTHVSTEMLLHAQQQSRAGILAADIVELTIPELLTELRVEEGSLKAAHIAVAHAEILARLDVERARRAAYATSRT